MNIQALIFDLDGTAVPTKLDGVPSQKVIHAVQQAKKLCHVSIATGRPYEMSLNIIKALRIEDLCIFNGGASLYSCKTNEYVWQQQMDPNLLQELFFQLNKDYGDYMMEDELLNQRIKVSQYDPKTPVRLACMYALTKEEASSLVAIVQKVNGFTAHAMNSWTPGFLDVHITHELATKKHAMQALLAHLNVDHKQVMVVGDGGNDLPLFELAGVKVAMGNASQELKAKADWIAPSLDEDGLVIAIEKYILAG